MRNGNIGTILKGPPSYNLEGRSLTMRGTCCSMCQVSLYVSVIRRLHNLMGNTPIYIFLCVISKYTVLEYDVRVVNNEVEDSNPYLE